MAGMCFNSSSIAIFSIHISWMSQHRLYISGTYVIMSIFCSVFIPWTRAHLPVVNRVINFDRVIMFMYSGIYSFHQIQVGRKVYIFFYDLR